MMFQQAALFRAGELIVKLHKEREVELKAFLKMNTADSLQEAKVLYAEMEALSTAGMVVVERLQQGLDNGR